MGAGSSTLTIAGANRARRTPLACPLCGSGLRPAGDGLACIADGAAFPYHPAGLLDLRPPSIRTEAERFAARYRAARLADGWHPLSARVAAALPDGDPSGFSRLYWTVRRESWAALRSVIERVGPAPLLLADLGAGFPWLSHRLAALGHRVVALDLSADPDFGLGAARLYPTARLVAPASFSVKNEPVAGGFLPVLGDLTAPPLAAHRYDLLICNASLHYVDDLATVLARLATALGPAGAIIVLDSPTAEQPRGGDQPGSRVLGRDELTGALRRAGLAVTWQEVRRGWLWTRHQLKNRMLRRDVFGFPLVTGRRGA